MGEQDASRRRVRRVARGSLGCWVATVLALAWARAWGARTRYDESARMFVCSGMRGGFARGGTTVGGVFLTRREPGPRLLRHEAVHVDQWARHGFTFPVRYLLEERRRPGWRNRFEAEAGLRDGGYRPPPVT